MESSRPSDGDPGPQPGSAIPAPRPRPNPRHRPSAGERARPPAVSRALLGSALLLGPLLAAGPAADPGPVRAGTAVAPNRVGPVAAPDTSFRIGGEHGLWVEGEGGKVRVQWLSLGDEPGRLVVRAGGRTIHEAETPAGIRHASRFPLPDADRVELAYGAAGEGADLHRTTIRLPLDPPPPAGEAAPPDTLFVVGDVHGEFRSLVRLLRHTGVVGEDREWTGGRSHLVLLGDLFDRGPHVTRTLWFLYRLEEEARSAGGRLHVVLGNHEIMTWSGDTRYVSSEEGLLADFHRVPYGKLFHPERSVLGRWLASKPAVLRVGDLLLAHGGVSPAYAGRSPEAMNDSLRAWLAEPGFPDWQEEEASGTGYPDSLPGGAAEGCPGAADSTPGGGPGLDSAAIQRRREFFHGSAGPFWFRGWVNAAVAAADAASGAGNGADTGARPPGSGADSTGPAGQAARALERMLRLQGAARHVVGHTALPTIRSFWEGRLVAADLRDPATELLMLVREGEGTGGDYAAYRYPTDGPPERLDGGPGPGGTR